MATAAGSTSGRWWWSVMITSIPRTAASAISATLVDPVSTVTMSAIPSPAAVSTAAVDRPWPSSSRLGHVRHRVEAEAAERQHELGEPRQAVGIEVAEHHDPLVPVDGVGGCAPPGGRRRVAAGGRSGRPRPGRGSAPWPPGRRSRAGPGPSPRRCRDRARGPRPGPRDRDGGAPERPSGDARRSSSGGCHVRLMPGLRASRRREPRRRPADHVAARRLGRAASSASRRLSSRRCQTTSSGPR